MPPDDYELRPIGPEEADAFLATSADAFLDELYDEEAALWLRLLDVGAALGARAYASDVALTVGVRDAFLPDNAGAWRLEPGSCARTDAPPDLELDARDLAAAYLGGVPVTALAAAGLVEERAVGAVERLDAALRTRRAPYVADDF